MKHLFCLMLAVCLVFASAGCAPDNIPLEEHRKVVSENTELKSQISSQKEKEPMKIRFVGNLAYLIPKFWTEETESMDGTKVSTYQNNENTFTIVQVSADPMMKTLKLNVIAQGMVEIFRSDCNLKEAHLKHMTLNGMETIKLTGLMSDNGTVVGTQIYFFSHEEYFMMFFFMQLAKIDDEYQEYIDEIMNSVTAFEIPLNVPAEPFSKNTGTDGSEAKVTKAQFDTAENGMTYEEVERIFGAKRMPYFENSGKNGEKTLDAYRWEGKGDIDANTIVFFLEGKGISKMQSGLK